MFSLRMLLAVVTLCAVYVAGMLFRTPWWEATILTLTYMIFAGLIAAAILSRERRAFFVTFAAFGLAYCVSVYFRMELVTTRGSMNWPRVFRRRLILVLTFRLHPRTSLRVVTL